MRKLNYALLSAQSIADPQKRALVLTRAALEEVQTLQLLAQVLAEAEAAAADIEDPEVREKALLAVEKTIQRVGYDRDHQIFMVPQNAAS